MASDGEVDKKKRAIEEDELLKETEPEADEAHSLKLVLSNMTTSIDKMAASFLVMSENIISSRRSSASEGTDSSDAGRKRRKSVQSSSSDNNSNESDTDEQTRALIKKRGLKKSGKDGETLSKEQRTDLLKGVAQDFDDEEETDAAISENLAGIVNKRWTNHLNPSKLKEKMDKYSRPENCTGLKVPRVNPEIWNKLDHFTKRQDLRAGTLQRAIVKVGSILTKTMDK